MPQTFAQYLIERVLPTGMKVTKPVDKKELTRILTDVFRNHPDKYPQVVSDLKRLGDKFSTYEGLSFGMDDISTPNKAKRDAIITDYKSRMDKAKTPEERLRLLQEVQDKVVANDMTPGDTQGNSNLMVTSGGMGGKRFQLLKTRTSPVVFKDHKGDLVPEIVGKSYAEGLNPLDYWNNAAEARSNLVQGQVQTSEPGVINKITHNLMGSIVISAEDCGTKQGVQLFTKDEDVIDRYLAADAGKFKRNTLVTSEVQQELLRDKVEKIQVRSPQTCEAQDNTVCKRCMGLSISHRKNLTIGSNVGTTSAGALSEVSTQLVLSAKHSTTLASKKEDLSGMKGFNMVVNMPKIYPNEQLVCEVYGKIERLFVAPQGGKYLWIRETKRVPDRFIEQAALVENRGRLWQYHIPPQRKLLADIKEKAEVYPGKILTDGNPNLKTIARLQGLGLARSAATHLTQTVYKNTGHNLDRRHFEMLSRAMLNYVKLDKVPVNFPLQLGETVHYNKLKALVDKLPRRAMELDQALGKVLAEDLHGVTIGTTLTPVVAEHLSQFGVKRVQITDDLELTAVVTPITRAQNQDSDNWLAKLNHRYLKSSITEAAQQGQSQALRTYSPHAAYAYGAEMTDKDEKGRY